MKKNMQDAIVIYKSKNKGARLEVRLKKGTVWLNQEQIASLFGTQRPAITKHLKNIIDEGELKEKSVCSILEHTAEDGKVYRTKFYNLDAIVSVGYRVNSRNATQFRIWATKVLRQYLINGYVLSEKRLLEQSKEKLVRLQKTINIIYEKLEVPALEGQAQELFSIIRDYASSLTLLYQYDEGKIQGRGKRKVRFRLCYNECNEIISGIRNELLVKQEAGPLFGVEVEGRFMAVLGALNQTFDKQELYSTTEEKAAHLLYFTIKDHPFVDGNKRIGSIMFIYFLERNNMLFRKNGQRKISDAALTALALLIATSDPKEKEVMIALIMNLIE